MSFLLCLDFVFSVTHVLPDMNHFVGSKWSSKSKVNLALGTPVVSGGNVAMKAVTEW